MDCSVVLGVVVKRPEALTENHTTDTIPTTFYLHHQLSLFTHLHAKILNTFYIFNDTGSTPAVLCNELIMACCEK